MRRCGPSPRASSASMPRWQAARGSLRRCCGTSAGARCAPRESDAVARGEADQEGVELALADCGGEVGWIGRAAVDSLVPAEAADRGACQLRIDEGLQARVISDGVELPAGDGGADFRTQSR